MRLFQKISNEFLYPSALKLHALAVQKTESKKYQDRASKLLRKHSPGALLYQDFMCTIGSAAPKLIEIFLEKRRAEYITNSSATNNGQNIYYVSEIYDSLEELSLEEASSILSLAKVKNPSVVDLLRASIENKNKDEFVRVLLDYECNLIDVNKALLYNEIIHTKTNIYTQGGDIIDPDDIEKVIIVIIEQISYLLSVNIGDINNNFSPTLKWYVASLKEFCKDNNERLEKPIPNTREAIGNEFISILDDFFPRYVEMQYEFYVRWYLDMEEILVKEERAVYLEFVRVPEYQDKFCKIEKEYFQLTNDSPFINVKPRQLSEIIKYLKEKASHKPGNRAEEKEFCLTDVLDGIIALSILGKYKIPTTGETKRVHQLCEWLDEYIPKSELNNPTKRGKVSEHLRKEERYGCACIKKNVEELKQLGII